MKNNILTINKEKEVLCLNCNKIRLVPYNHFYNYINKGKNLCYKCSADLP